GVNGVAAYRVGRRHEVNLVQSGGAADQRIVGDDDARCDCATAICAVCRYDVEGGGGAEVEHDGWSAIQGNHRRRVDDTICACLCGLVNLDANVGIGGVGDDQRIDVQIAF